MSARESITVNQLLDQTGVETPIPRSSRTSVIRTTATGVTTLVAAARVDRRVLIMTTVDTTFAAGDGAAPIFSVGQTGTTTKFINAKATGTAAEKLMFDGVLTAGTALILTSTAATGTTSAGALTITAMVV